VDNCPCGASVSVESVTPDLHGWITHCDAGHRLFLVDLHSPGVILDDVETRVV
jgi:hypothetical protein